MTEKIKQRKEKDKLNVDKSRWENVHIENYDKIPKENRSAAKCSSIVFTKATKDEIEATTTGGEFQRATAEGMDQNRQVDKEH